MTLTGAATALAAASAFWGTPVHADMATALSLCLDTDLDIQARAAAFENQGWSPVADENELLEIHASGATLLALDALEPSSWSETRTWAYGFAQELLRRPEFVKAIALRSPSFHSAIVLQRNLAGLQTCLYAGNDPDLGPVAQILDGSILRTIGSIQRIRGDGPKSSIAAHFLDETGRAQIAPPLQFGATFSVVLDRQLGDLQ
ncbi:MAG: hypothetical protein ACR2O1_01250 [Boseongicola sp.]